MDIQSMPISDIIPQRQPFLLVDNVEEYGNSYVVTKFSVDVNNVFVDNDMMSAEGMIENMAQSSSILMGIERLGINVTDKLPVGVICQIKNCIIEKRPHIHNILSTSIHLSDMFSNMCKVKACIMVSGERIAEGEFTLAILND